MTDWRSRAKAQFNCEKQPATASRGMVVTNHPVASAAGAEMLAGGGNAIDAAIAALFTLTVVEPMMVGIFGGGMSHLRLADGRHTVIDGLSTAPLATSASYYRPVASSGPDYMEVADRENTVGVKAVATPGNLKAWCETLARFGTLPLADVLQPAIRAAAQGFTVTEYLSECIADCVPDLARDREISVLFLPGGQPIRAGARLIASDYAATLRAIAAQGPELLYQGSLGRSIADHFARTGGALGMRDLESYRTVEREVVRGHYRGVEIVGPPPPSSGGVHVIQMLNILERYDIRGMGFGSGDALHLLAECLKIAFADRRAATADPAFVRVPVARLLSKDYALERSRDIDLQRARSWAAGVATGESANTTHVTVADGIGNIVSSTQTINNLFGARFIVPGTGIIPNNYMHLFDPHPGQTLSIAPGKRITTSQAPVMALRDSRPLLALGLPGGLRIFGSAMQALVNYIDHGMTLQETVEAPRLWTQGAELEIEEDYGSTAAAALSARGHHVVPVKHVGGGMNAIQFNPDGSMTGAACWRADGVPIGISGGYARRGVRFWPDRVRGTGASPVRS